MFKIAGVQKWSKLLLNHLIRFVCHRRDRPIVGRGQSIPHAQHEVHMQVGGRRRRRGQHASVMFPRRNLQATQAIYQHQRGSKWSHVSADLDTTPAGGLTVPCHAYHVSRRCWLRQAPTQAVQNICRPVQEKNRLVQIGLRRDTDGSWRSVSNPTLCFVEIRLLHCRFAR